MSKVKIEGHGTGTGTFTVTTPSSNTDRTITLPDSTGTLATTADNGSQLDHSGSKKIEAVSTGAAVTGNLTTTGNISTGNNGMVFILDSAGQTSGRIVTDSSAANALEIGADPNNQASGSYTAFRVDNTERMRITPDGLTFNGDTAAANALDDYEEGYYTVSISGSTSGSFNMAGNDTLAYTKIGRLVTIQGYIGAQSGSVGGNVRMSLPFAPTNLGVDDQTYNFPSVMIQNQGNTIAGQKYLFLQADGSAYLYKVADDGSAGYISNSDVDGNFEIGVSFTYISG